MAERLDILASNTPKDQFKITREHNKKLTEEQFSLLIRKGVYPYDYVDSFEKFSQTHLPPKSVFHSKLKDKDISDDEYEHAKRYGTLSIFRTWVSILTCTWKQMFYY